ncbi:MAG: hypothetical protein ACRDTV_25570 [Mycobacterium sp.]
MRIRDLFIKVGRSARSGRIEIDVVGPPEDVEVAGESYHRDAFARIFTAAGMPRGGTLMRTAAVVPEPTNKDHPNAVAVYIEGQLVGYIPHGEAPEVLAEAREHNESGRHLTVPARVWASSEDGVWRARVTLRFSGRGGREWAYVDERSRLARLRDAEAAAQADGFKIASLRPEIERAKQAGDDYTALGLLRVCVDAADRQAEVLQRRPVAWPTEQAAMVLQQLRDYTAAIDLLQRFINADPEGRGTTAIQTRLAMVRDHMALAQAAADARRKLRS